MNNWPLLALLLPFVAAAEPFFTHQGRLIDSVGDPVEGEQDLRIALHDDASAGSTCWEQDYTDVEVENGYFAVQVSGLDGTGRALGEVDAGCRWLALSLAGGPSFGPRQRVSDAPFGSGGAALAAPMPTFSTLDGTPKAVGLLTQGTALAFAWDGTGLHTDEAGSDRFLGFATGTATRSGHELLDYTVQGNGATYTVPAGDDRYLLVYISNQDGRDSGHNVTGISFGGAAMTNLASVGTTGIVGGVDSGGHYLYGMPLGSDAATSTGVITATFDGAGSATIQAHTLGNVDQAAPVAHTYAGAHSATRSTSASVGGTFFGTELEAYGVYTGQNTQGFTDTVGGLQHASITAPSRTIRAFKSSTSNWYGFMAMVALRPSTGASTADVQVSGTVSGFTGLTQGAFYYLSSTEAGGISTTAVGAPIGVAVSATELLILPRG